MTTGAIWSSIPNDVIAWFRDAFAKANKAVSEVLLNVPNVRETSLDDAFIQALIPRSAPTRLGSGALVRMDVHNIGGLRRVLRWEVADIGIVVFVVRAKRIVARKIALLQAKRLYPDNNVVDDEDPTGFQYGINAIMRHDLSPVSMTLAQRFDFHSQCKYGAIEAESPQVTSIKDFSRKSGYFVDYLLYNPQKMPISISYPVLQQKVLRRPPTVGCRVVRAAAVHSLLSRLPKGSVPTYHQIKYCAGSDYWRVEHWAADLLLRCKVGREFDSADESSIIEILERRSGPIGAAIAAYIELPPE
jgi:hypothetical protein